MFIISITAASFGVSPTSSVFVLQLSERDPDRRGFRGWAQEVEPRQSTQPCRNRSLASTFERPGQPLGDPILCLPGSGFPFQWRQGAFSRHVSMCPKSALLSSNRVFNNPSLCQKRVVSLAVSHTSESESGCHSRSARISR